MSYPFQIQALVVEDEEDVKEVYDLVFEEFRKEFKECPIVRQAYAFCYADALEQLQSSRIFHLVILDLQLPETPGLPATPTVDYGLSLLAECARRERFPIPAMLVVSGHIDKLDRARLDIVREEFYHGRVRPKGDLNLLRDEIRLALVAIERYCGAGIHLRDSLQERYPTISPREEDLLRRSVLEQEGGVGLDVEWWSADECPATKRQERTSAVWTKVLMGRYLLDQGDRASRPKFFKLFPTQLAGAIVQPARRMENKLSHIKVASTILSNQRSLIVTEKVGSSDQRPLTLSGYLSSPKTSHSGLARVAEQIFIQTTEIGQSGPRVEPVCSLLWKWHKEINLKAQWEKFGGPKLIEDGLLRVDPVKLFAEVVHDKTSVRFYAITFGHGDLHINNVALDVNSSYPEAFIFDASGSSEEVNIKDLATLEVSLLLHQASKNGLVMLCSSLYQGELSPEKIEFGDGRTMENNTFELLRQIRFQVSTISSPEIYALLVFDQALVQLEGLAFGVSRNKISDPREAVHLASLAAEHYAIFRFRSRVLASRIIAPDESQ